MGSPKMAAKWWMGNKNVVHIRNEIDSAENKNENVKISDKWMEVKNIYIQWSNLGPKRQMGHVLFHM